MEVGIHSLEPLGPSGPSGPLGPSEPLGPSGPSKPLEPLDPWEPLEALEVLGSLLRTKHHTVAGVYPGMLVRHQVAAYYPSPFFDWLISIMSPSNKCHSFPCVLRRMLAAT